MDFTSIPDPVGCQLVMGEPAENEERI